MNLSALPGAIGSAVSVLVVSWLLSRIRSRPIPREDGTKVLRYPAAYACIGWASFIVFVYFSALCFFFSKDSLKDSPRAKVACGSGFGGFALLSAVLILSHRRCSLAYSADTICYTPLWGKPYIFTWSDVDYVKFSYIADWWRLHLRDRRTVRVGTLMIGASEFVQTLATETRLRIPLVPPSQLTPRAPHDS